MIQKEVKMTEIKTSKIEIKTPNSIFSFKLDMIGEESGARFRGKFIYKRPTIGMRRDISQIETILNQQYREKYDVEILSSEVKTYNYTYAFLKVCLKECPDWLIKSDYGFHMEDENVINFISMKLKSFERDRIEDLEKMLAQPRKPLDEKDIIEAQDE